MQGLALDELTEKERGLIRKEKEKGLAKVAEMVNGKGKSEEQVLKDLYARCREKMGSKLQKEKEIQTSTRRTEALIGEKDNMAKEVDRLRKEAGVLRSLVETLEQQNAALMAEHNKLLETEQTKRLQLNEQMQQEIKDTQTQVEQDLQRKGMLSSENEELAKRIEDMKQLFQTTRASIEKTLGNSEFDMGGLEEQLRQKIEVETTKLVVGPFSQN